MRSFDDNDLRALSRAVDRTAIVDVLAAYAHGIDRRDSDLVLACFHEDAVFEHGGEPMPVAKFFELSASAADGLRATMHHLTNVVVDIEGDDAKTQAYVLAYHQVKAEGPDRPPLFPLKGKEYGVLIGGRYVDRFERRNGLWRIVHRRLVFEWTANVEGPAFPLAGDDSIGRFLPSFGIGRTERK